MGKISPVSAKYIVHATIEIEGVVDRPDVIGAIFGQTEGLLGSDLELRELQRSGRIGRIEVNVDTRSGKSKGEIVIPSSLDKAETSIIAAAIEIIQRIGPCNARIKVHNIEDVRVSKRNQVVERAKALLKELMDSTMPDSQEIAEEVAHSVRVMEIQEYGRERLPAGPFIDDSEDIIVVEGRADVITLLKEGMKNAIGLNGTSVPQTIVELSRKKEVTVFVDGDRGGDLIIKELMGVAEIDFVAKASPGKEVEELSKKEIHKALRAKVAVEQAKMEIGKNGGSQEAAGGSSNQASGRQNERQPDRSQKKPQQKPQQQRPQQGAQQKPQQQRPQQGAQQKPQQQKPQQGAQQKPARKAKLSDNEKSKFSSMLDDLIGTRGAYLLDSKLNILGKVPTTELLTTIKSLGTGVYAVVFDGSVDKDLVDIAERSRIQFLVCMDSKHSGSQKVNILTAEDL
ncbi:MAG: DNA primase DnaG [Candidatus Woesearchaeota archaeon]